MTRMPMSHADRTRFYKTLTGTNESVEAPLQLSAQSAYNYLTQYGVEIVSDEEITDLYLSRILHDLKTGRRFHPVVRKRQRSRCQAVARFAPLEAGAVSFLRGEATIRPMLPVSLSGSPA